MESYRRLRAAERERWSPPGTSSHITAQSQVVCPAHTYIRAMLSALSSLTTHVYTYTYGRAIIKEEVWIWEVGAWEELAGEGRCRRMFFVYVLKNTKLKFKSQERNPGVGTPRPLTQHRASWMVSHPRVLRSSRVVLRNFYVVCLKNDLFLHPPIYLLSLLISECLQVSLASTFVE